MNRRTPKATSKAIKSWEQAYKSAKVVRLDDYRTIHTASPFDRPHGKAKVYSFETKKPVPRFKVGDRVWIDSKNPWGAFIVTGVIDRTGCYGYEVGDYDVRLKTVSGGGMLPMPSTRLITEKEYQALARKRKGRAR